MHRIFDNSAFAFVHVVFSVFLECHMALFNIVYRDPRLVERILSDACQTFVECPHGSERGDNRAFFFGYRPGKVDNVKCSTVVTPFTYFRGSMIMCWPDGS